MLLNENCTYADVAFRFRCRVLLVGKLYKIYKADPAAFDHPLPSVQARE